MPQRAWAYIKNFRFQSVFFKYFRLILCIIIVPILLLNAGVFLIYRQVSERDIANANLQTLSRSLNASNMVFQEIDNLRRTVAGSVSAQAVLSLVGSASNAEKQDLAYSLAEIVATHTYIQSVYAYSYKEEYCYASKNSSFLSMFYDTGFLSEEAGAQHSETAIWSRVVPAFGGSAPVPVLTVRSPIYVHDQLSGLFVINLSIEELTSLIAPAGTEETLLLTDKNGQVLFSSDAVYMDQAFADTGLPAPDEEELKNSSFIFSRQDGNFVASLYDESSDRRCYLITPVSAGGASSMLGFTIIAFVVISVLGCLFLSFLITTKFYQSLVRLIQAVQFQEDTTHGTSDSSYNEFTYITDNIAKITDKNKEFEKKLVEQLEKLKKSQSIALQTQMNPHFLFNTLQAVNVMTIGVFKEDNKVTQIISLLADLLHYMLDTKTYLIPLDQEIELTEKYLEIQNIKYCDQFLIHWDIEPDTRKLNVVKLILQPIVENAILHGILPTKKPGNVWISTTRTKNLLTITVEDDGVGIPDEKLRELQQYLGDSTIREAEHLGVTNTHQRLQLIFGKDYGLTIGRREGGGTIVRLEMPAAELSSPH